MRVTVKGFIYHKEAETFEDCFDRYAVNINNHKFSVSDGVSKSFFPGLWAELLVETFVSSKGKIGLDNTELIKLIQKKWKDEVFEIVNRPNQKYYVKNFFAQGRSAAATFVGLDFFYDNGKPYWESIALGDSFLFFVPTGIIDLNRQFAEIFHLSSKKNFEFDNFPDFFDSTQTINKGKIKQVTHELRSGTFYLMTDALSEWFINSKQSAIKEMETWDSQKTFEERISKLRKDSMHNDDAAILIIDVIDDNSKVINYAEVEYSSLKKLQGKVDEGIKSDYQQEIQNISEQFLAPSRTLAKTESLDTSIKDSEKTPVQKDYISKRKKKKKKKRGFWESPLQTLKGLFSSTTLDKDDEDSHQNATDRNEKKGGNNKSDIDSITNKF